MEISINYLGVLIAGIGGMVVGALWYSPILFGKLWTSLSCMTEEQMAASKAKGMGKTYTITFIFELVTAYVLAHFISILAIEGVSAASSLVFWAWLGFIVPVMIGSMLWEKKSFKLFVLNATSRLISLFVMGIMLLLI